MNNETRALLYDALMLLREDLVRLDFDLEDHTALCAACSDPVPWHTDDCRMVSITRRLEVALGLTREGS